MSTASHQPFDDRMFMVIGIPAISFLVAAFFLEEGILTGDWESFLVRWMISMLYTATYWIISRWIISFWRKRDPSIDQTVWRLIKTVVSLLSIVVGFELLCYYGISYEDLFPLTRQYGHRIIETAPISMLLVVAVAGIYEAVYFFSLYRKAEIDKERLLRSQIENQLEVLRKQVDPHFLFNSLNTLAAIIPEDTQAAVQFTERLSATYRRLLEWRHLGTVTLRQELQALADYMHLLEVRFEDRLKVEIEVDPPLQEFYVVPLVLQMLLENAVKHNEASNAHPLVVKIKASGQNIVVSNNKRLKAKTAVDSTGFGLENLRDRVNYLCKQELIVRENAEVFEVSIPLMEMADLQLVKQMSKEAP